MPQPVPNPAMEVMRDKTWILLLLLVELLNLLVFGFILLWMRRRTQQRDAAASAHKDSETKAAASTPAGESLRRTGTPIPSGDARREYLDKLEALQDPLDLCYAMQGAADILAGLVRVQEALNEANIFYYAHPEELRKFEGAYGHLLDAWYVLFFQKQQVAKYEQVPAEEHGQLKRALAEFRKALTDLQAQVENG